MDLEQVQSHKYLRSTVSSDNSIEEALKNRITLGNKAYYANQFFFKSRFASKKSKLKLYWSITRPTVTYSCETWVWKETIKTS
jgi:hypothetical protein